MLQLVKWWFATSPSVGKTTAPIRNVRLQIDPLEDRYVPASVGVLSPVPMAAAAVSTVSANQSLPAFGDEAWNAPAAHRGFMVSPSTFADRATRLAAIAELKSWNVNLVRWQINIQTLQGLSDQFSDVVKRIKDAAPDFQKAGIGIILDLHPANDPTNALNSVLDRSSSARAKFIDFWKNMASQFKTNSAIVGYDLLNEPLMDGKTWSNLAASTIEALRKIDKNTTIVLEPIGGSPKRLGGLPSYAEKDNVVYSVHMYEPGAYTGGGVDPDGPAGPKPANPIVPYTKAVQEQAKDTIETIRKWQQANRARIYVGEFSVSRLEPGAANYLNLCMDAFEKYGWDWTYHAYREADIWNLNLGDPSSLDAVRSRLNRNAANSSFAIDASIGATDLARMNAWTFYPQYYLAQYPDLQRAFGNDLAKATEHWQRFGIKEGRLPNPYFSAPVYLARYPDLRAAFGNNFLTAATHWLTSGIKEGRIGN